MIFLNYVMYSGYQNQKETIMNTNTLPISKKIFISKHSSRQLVLFNKKELQILNKLKPSQKGVESIKKIKEIFNGELV